MEGDGEETKTMDAVELPDQALELTFHPERDVMASGLVDGRVCLHTYSSEGHELALEVTHHQASCRSVMFSEKGDALYTASKDRSIAAVGETGQVTWHQQDAHLWSINTLCNISEGVLASGDDQGVIKIWDIRTKAEVTKCDNNSDFISDMVINEAADKLLATSGDATLTVFDLRRNKLEGKVTNQEDELLSVQILKGGERVVCGTQSGALVTWPWGAWGERSNRFRGHPESVDTLLKLDEDTVLTGSSDGIIRVVSIQPDKFLGLLGDHEDFPVESIQFSRDKAWIGSVSHDNKIRFWHAEYLFDDDDEQEDDEGVVGDVSHAAAADGDEGKDKSEMDTDSAEEGAGAGNGDASDSDDDSSDDEDMGQGEEAGPKSARGKRKKRKGGRRKATAPAPASKKDNFFADL